MMSERKDVAPTFADDEQPTEPGWYASLSGNDYLIYLRMEDIDIPDVFTRKGQWMAFTQSGEATQCDWGYIAQAGPIVRLVKEIEGAHLDPRRAAEVLDWCKREGGLDLYGWGDLISRLQDCIVPIPPDAPAKVSEAYRQGYADGRREAVS